jgi:hypothetical protein
MSDDLVERLRTEYDRFARTPKYDKLWLAPATHERLASLWLEAADAINAIEHLGHVETLRGRLEEVERLRNERDEARRRYQIVLDFSHHLLTERAAARQCAKKETDNA